MSAPNRLRARIRRVLAGFRAHERAAVLLGGALGFGAAMVHVSGLVLGGSLVGVPAPSMRRAAGYGLGFGILVWVAFASTLALRGVFDAYLGMGQLTLLSVGAAIGLPLLGALAARGLT